jgi:hypothetical protein
MYAWRSNSGSKRWGLSGGSDLVVLPPKLWLANCYFARPQGM